MAEGESQPKQESAVIKKAPKYKKDKRSEPRVQIDYLKEHINRAYPIVKSEPDFQELTDTNSIFAVNNPAKMSPKTRTKFERGQVPQYLLRQLEKHANEQDIQDQQLETTKAQLEAEKHKTEAEQATLLATKDELTGLIKRRAFEELIEAEASRINREWRQRNEHDENVRYEDLNQHAVIGKMDIDGYGKFNDLYGHATGDDVLKQLAAALQNGSRRSDIYARIGGEEIGFLDSFLLNEIYNSENYEQSGERIRKLVEALNISSNTRQGFRDNLKITISTGTTEYIPGEDYTLAMSRADLGERIAKVLGKNRTVHVTRENGSDKILYIEDITNHHLYTYYLEPTRELLVDEINEQVMVFATPTPDAKQKLYDLVETTDKGDLLKDKDTNILYLRFPKTDPETGNTTMVMQEHLAA